MEEIVNEIQKVTFSNGQTFQQLFKYVKIIGEGAFGLVIQVQRQLGDEVAYRALKIIKKSVVPQYAFEKIRNEASILQQLQAGYQTEKDGPLEEDSYLNETNQKSHPNIVQFYQLYETEQFGIIEMEYAPDGTIGDLIKRFRQMAKTQEVPYDHDYEVSQIMDQLIQAVQVVHEHDFVHRDLKPDNILCSKSNNENHQYNIKLADFGLAAHFKVSLSQKDQLMERAGTFKYMAPEQASQGKIYGKKIDMWACGIIMYKLLSCGDHPIASGKIAELEFTELLKDPQWNFPEYFTDYAIDFFLKLCDVSPTNRYTAQQALQHPWINRNFVSSPIPKTQKEAIIDQSAQVKLKQAVNFALLTQIIKGKHTDLVKTKSFLEYKQKCKDFIQRPQSRSQNFHDSLYHTKSKYRLSSDHTLSPAGANKSIMSSPAHSFSSPKKTERLKGIKFHIETTENEPETLHSMRSPERTPKRASVFDPKQLIFKDQKQFQAIQENANDDAVGDTNQSRLINFDSLNLKSKANLPPQFQNKNKKQLSKIAPVTEQSQLTSYDDRKNHFLQSDSNQLIQGKIDPNFSSAGHSEAFGNMVEFIMPQLDIDIIDNYETQNQVSLLTQKYSHRSRAKVSKTSKLLTPREKLDQEPESNYDQYVKAVHTLQKDQYMNKVGTTLIDATVKQERPQIFLVSGVYSKNVQSPEQISEVYLQDKKILVKNNSQEKLSPGNVRIKKQLFSNHSKKRSVTVLKRQGSQPKETKKNITLNLPEIGINSSLYKSRSKKSLKYKTPKSRSKKKVSNESVDLSEEDLDDAYQNNIVNLKLNNNIGKQTKKPQSLLIGSPRRHDMNLPQINPSSNPSPFNRGKKSPSQESLISQNKFGSRRTSAISEIISGVHPLENQNSLHLNKIYHNINKLRIQMDQKLEKQDKGYSIGFKKQEITPQNMNFKYLAHISPLYKDLIGMIKQRHHDRENLRSKLQQAERRLSVGTDRVGFGSMSQSPTHKHKKLIQDKDGVRKMQSQLEKIRHQMEANNLGLDGTAIDSTCINDTFEKITALGMPIDSMMMKYSTLKPLIQSSSPRSGSPPQVTYEQFIEEIRNFLKDQAIGNPSPVNQQILQLKDNQILMLAQNLVDNTIQKQEGSFSPVITLNHTGPIDQGVGVVTESFSQQIQERSNGRHNTKVTRTDTLQLNNSKIVSGSNSPMVTVQKLQRQAALDKKKYGAITHTMTHESDDELKVYNPHGRPTSTRLDQQQTSNKFIIQTLESPRSGTLQNTTNLQSREDIQSPRNFDENDENGILTEVTEAAKSSIIGGDQSQQKTPFSPQQTPFSKKTSLVKEKKEPQILLNDNQKIYESPQQSQRKVVSTSRKKIHVQFQSANQSIERTLKNGGSQSGLQQMHQYPNNADLQAMRDSLQHEKMHYTKFDPSSVNPKVIAFKNYKDLRREQERIDKLILSNHQVDAKSYAVQARKNLEKKQQYLEQQRQDQKLRAEQNQSSKVQFEFQQGVSQVYGPVLKTQALGQVLITDEDQEEFQLLNNPITLAQPSHAGQSIEVTVSKAISGNETTHDEPSHTPLQPSQSRDQLLVLPKASTNSLTISDNALMQLQAQDQKMSAKKLSPENSMSLRVSQELKQKKVLNIDHEMRKMMQENKKLEHHVDVRASVQSESQQQNEGKKKIYSNFQIVHQVINDYTKKIDSNGTTFKGVTKNESLMSQLSNINANTQDLDYSHYGSPASRRETPGIIERHVRLSARNQQNWKQRKLSTINDVNSRVRKEDTEITLDKEDDEGSYAMIDKDEEILIEEQGLASYNEDISKTPIVMMNSFGASRGRQRSPVEVQRLFQLPNKIHQKGSEDSNKLKQTGQKKHINIIKIQNPTPQRNNQSSQMSQIHVIHKSNQVAQGTQMSIPTATNFLSKWEHLSEAKGETRMIAHYKNSQGELVSNRTMSNIEPNEHKALQAMIEMDQTKRPFDQITMENNPNIKIVRRLKSPKRSVDLKSGERFPNSKSNSRSSDLRLFETEQSKFDPLSPKSVMFKEQLSLFEQRKLHLTIVRNQIPQPNSINKNQIKIMKMDNELLDFSEMIGVPQSNWAPQVVQNTQGRNHPLTFRKKQSIKQSVKSNYNSSQRGQAHSALGLIGVGTQVAMPSRQASQLSAMSIVDQQLAIRKTKKIEIQNNQDIIFGMGGSQYEDYLVKHRIAAEREHLMPSRMKNISQINNISAVPTPKNIHRAELSRKNSLLSGKNSFKDNKRSTIQMVSQPSHNGNPESSINYIPKNTKMDKTQVGSW